jgi:hypothetical protein
MSKLVSEYIAIPAQENDYSDGFYVAFFSPSKQDGDTILIQATVSFSRQTLRLSKFPAPNIGPENDYS